MTMRLNKEEFKINTNSVAFKLLTEKLYSDPLQSTIRELVNNAYDSYVDKSKKENIDIQSIKPISIDLEEIDLIKMSITIRDYGTGLSKEFMETLYTTYFHSDKGERNDLIGGFGIGSKSPLSLAKEFISTSYYNGMKYSYLIFLDENGMPSFTMLSEEPTDEENGLKINFNINKSNIDLDEFYNYNFYKFVPVNIYINNVLACNKDLTNDITIFEDDDLKIGVLFSKENNTDNNSLYPRDLYLYAETHLYIKFGNNIYKVKDELYDAIYNINKDNNISYRSEINNFFRLICLDIANKNDIPADSSHRLYLELKSIKPSLSLSRENLEINSDILNFFNNNSYKIINVISSDLLDSKKETIENMLKFLKEKNYINFFTMFSKITNKSNHSYNDINNNSFVYNKIIDLFNILSKDMNINFNWFKILFSAKVTKYYSYNISSFMSRYRYVDLIDLNYLEILPYNSSNYYNYLKELAKLGKDNDIEVYNIIRSEDDKTQCIENTFNQDNGMFYLANFSNVNNVTDNNFIIISNNKINKSSISSFITNKISKVYNAKVFIVPDKIKDTFMELLSNILNELPFKPTILDNMDNSDKISISEIEYVKDKDGSYSINDYKSTKSIGSNYFSNDIDYYYIDDTIFKANLSSYYISEVLKYLSKKKTVKIICPKTINNDFLNKNNVKNLYELIYTFEEENKIIDTYYDYIKYIEASIVLSNSFNNVKLNEALNVVNDFQFPIINPNKINKNIRFDILEKVINNIENLSFANRKEDLIELFKYKNIDFKVLYNFVLKYKDFINSLYIIEKSINISQRHESFNKFMDCILTTPIKLNTKYFNLHNTNSSHTELEEDKAILFNIKKYLNLI